MDYRASIQVIDAFKIGSKKTASALPPNYFIEKVWGRLKELATESQVMIARRVGDLGQAALSDARANDIPSALRQILLAESMLPELGGIAREFAECCLLRPQKAYCMVKAGNYIEADELLRLSFLQDLVLEDTQLEILIMHRVQLFQNVIRLRAKQGRVQPALTFGHLVLEYLETGCPDCMATLPPPWHDGWTELNKLEEPALVSAMHGQIGKEHAALLNSGSIVAPECQAYLSWSPPVHAVLTQARLWWAYKAERATYKNTLKVNAAVALLRRGPVPSEPLWRSAAAELAAIIGAS